MTTAASDDTKLSDGIKLSVNAANKVAALIKEEGNPHLKLRVFVNGGGCSGFQYGFKFDEDIQEDDEVVTQLCSDNVTTIQLLIDPISYTYLKRAEIDYTGGLQGSFVINNPGVKATCGCGSSFTPYDDESEDEMNT